jgi:hypothetical protein
MQSLYFVLFAHSIGQEEADVDVDPFEQARQRMENILSREI